MGGTRAGRAAIGQGAAPNSRAIPDQRFNELFAALPSNRDRALVAFWISTGVRASELLGRGSATSTPARQLITVVRKGSRAISRLPASADAFVWLRLYQEELHGEVPPGRIQPVWWTLRRPRAAIDLSRGAPDVRARQRHLGLGLDLARSAPQRAARMAATRS